VTSPVRLFAVGLLAGAAASGCQQNKTTSASLTCKSFASAEALCADQGCDPTWTAVETNHAHCDTCAGGPWLAGDCGDYHVLTYTGVDTGSSYYYRRDSGALAAAQFFGAPNPTSTCYAVGAASFAVPPSCDTTTFSMLPSWCSLDAGAAGERALPCCSDALASCGASAVICPATWSEAQARAPSLCDAQSGGASAELGSCGGGHVLRYRLYGATPFTLYYDASGALIAVVDETTDRCAYGPMAGVTLPACTATLTSACPDGGAAP
jgi:hypothetical protein